MQHTTHMILELRIMLKTPAIGCDCGTHSARFICMTKQQDLGLELSTRRTRKEVLLDEVMVVMPWTELVALIAVRPGKRKQQTHTPWGAFNEQAERRKASIRAKVEHPFRVIKRRFGYVKVRYRWLAKNTAQIMTLFSLSNILMAGSSLLQGSPA